MTGDRRTCARLTVCLAAGLALSAGQGRAAEPARAGEPVRAVIELFTSQGCAVCRPADQVIGDLARRPDVLALTLPVTYWDYLGWKDTLAQPPFTERQRAYASLKGARQIFTPQVIVNGGASAVGSDRGALERLMREGGTGGPLPVSVRCEERGDRIVVDVGAEAGGGPAKGEVWLVPVLRNRPVSIERGENKGRVAIYVNVVRGLHRLGAWAGQAAHFEVPASTAQVAEADSYVIMLQGSANGRPGRILGAAKGPRL
ncbi:DUF1223 domain-containing protein [Methylobacterium sp. A54F]